MKTGFAALAAGIAALTLSAAQASAQDVAAGEKVLCQVQGLPSGR